MPESTKEALAIEKALQQKSQLPDGFDFRCQGPGCSQVLRKPRYLTFGTKMRCTTRQGQHVDEAVPDRRATWDWCSQECKDAYVAQFHVPGVHYEWRDQDGTLLGFYIPKRGYVRLEDADADTGAMP